MKVFFGYILSTIFYFFYGLSLLIFHVFQWLSYNLGGYAAHKKVVDIMNCWLVKLLLVTGTTVKCIKKHKIPVGVPIIFVSNHQSMHDISPIACFARKHHPKFISKIELGKGIPSVSYNLKHGGSVLINRKNAKQSLETIKRFAKYIEKNNYSAVIYPEGTRSKDGKPKRFSENGLRMLAEYAPSSYVVPITINNCWKINRAGMFPLDLGVKVTVEFHEAIKSSSLPFDQLFNKVENTIKEAIKS